MDIVPKETLLTKKCVPCEGGIAGLTEQQITLQLAQTPAWSTSDDQKWIRRKFRLKNFLQCVECIEYLAKLAEDEQHHPDLHLTGYRILEIAITTHAIGGLSENDFILAAKIDRLIEEHFPNAKA